MAGSRACWKKGYSPYGDYYDNLGNICRKPSAEINRNYAMLALVSTILLVLLLGYLLLLLARSRSSTDFTAQLEAAVYPRTIEGPSLTREAYEEKRQSVLLGHPGSKGSLTAHVPVLRRSPGSSTTTSSSDCTPDSTMSNVVDFPFSQHLSLHPPSDENAARRQQAGMTRTPKQSTGTAELVPLAHSSRRTSSSRPITLGPSPLSFSGSDGANRRLSAQGLPRPPSHFGRPSSALDRRTGSDPARSTGGGGLRLTRGARSTSPPVTGGRAGEVSVVELSDWRPLPPTAFRRSPARPPLAPRPHSTSTASKLSTVTFDLSTPPSAGAPVSPSSATCFKGSPPRAPVQPNPTDASARLFSHPPRAPVARPSPSPVQGPLSTTKDAHSRQPRRPSHVWSSSSTINQAGTSAAWRTLFTRPSRSDAISEGDETDRRISLPLFTNSSDEDDGLPLSLDPDSSTRVLTPPLQTFLPTRPRPRPTNPGSQPSPASSSVTACPARPPSGQGGFVVRRQRTYSGSEPLQTPQPLQASLVEVGESSEGSQDRSTASSTTVVDPEDERDERESLMVARSTETKPRSARETGGRLVVGQTVV